MKQVLLIAAPPLFNEFFKEKLTAENIKVEIALGIRDAYTKTVSILPDLIIVHVPEKYSNLRDYFDQKSRNPNAKSIPIILTGPVLKKEQLTELPSFNVVKYFNKPIKFEIFFDFIGKILKMPLTLDPTPCILELHLNENIIFIEIAQGFNLEKISLLKYKITEMIDSNKIKEPKVVFMMTDIELNFTDSINLEQLLINVTADFRIKSSNIKILTINPFVRDFIAGHEEFTEIEVVENLATVLTELVNDRQTESANDIISDKILTATADVDDGSIEMRSHSSLTSGDSQLSASPIEVAIVDDDHVVRRLLTATFESIQANCSVFHTGADFLTSTAKKTYDLIMLDIFIPDVSGFNILSALRNKKYKSPVIIYSAITQKEAVMQALSLGAKAYLIKPLKPEAIIQKAREILNRQ